MNMRNPLPATATAGYHERMTETSVMCRRVIGKALAKYTTLATGAITSVIKHGNKTIIIVEERRAAL